MSLLTGKLCIQKSIHYLHSQPRPYYAASQCQYIGIVVLSGGLSAEAVCTECCTDSLHLVRCYGNAYTCAADQNSLVTLSALNGFSDFSRINGIIHRLIAVTSEILVWNLVLLQISDNLLFQLKSAMVTA